MVEAVAQTSQANRENRKKSPPFTITLDLPGLVARFKSSRAANSTLDFMPFYGQGGEGKIFAIDSTGHAILHDADAVDDDYAGSTKMLPRLNMSKWRSPLSICVTAANPSAAKDHHPESISTKAPKKPPGRLFGCRRAKNAPLRAPGTCFAPDLRCSEALYALNTSSLGDFEALVHCNPSGFGGKDEDKAWHWRRLLPPPYLDDPACQHRTIHDGCFGTYCFDTSTHEWTNAGRWSLPFSGRAMRVWELDGLWFSFLGKDRQKLGVVDLSSLDSAPKVLHEWGGFAPPEDWSLVYSEMVYLGAKRFCIAKTFDIYDRGQLVDTASILIGVEIVNATTKKAMLRMIKHKSITFIFDRCGIDSVL
ncbi:hypothetical protein VPH35_046856 [Triticum aestivum]